MKKIRLTALLLSIGMLLCACSWQQNDPQNDPSNGNEQPPVQNNGSTPDNGDDSSEVQPFPCDLTVELVVDSDTANALLSHLDTLTEHLRQAMEAADYSPDTITITFSTAGAYTADSLREGGVVAAILPALDIIAAKDGVSIIALTGEEIPETAIAVSTAVTGYSEAFGSAMFRALTATDAGLEFLSLCCGDATFTTPTDEALQAVRDYREELEKNGGGHS